VEAPQIELAELVAPAREGAGPLLEADEVAWVPAGPRRPARVVGDRQRLQQVLSNLVGNAIKFTDPGGTITTTVIVADDQVEVAIEDTGRGIAPEFVTQVFQRYTRGQPAQAAGAGLGLMIVREIVEAHGGTVGVES